MRYLNGRAVPLPEPQEANAGVPGHERYVARHGAPQAVLVDIDGTTAIMCDRSPYDETRVAEDTPNLPVIAVIHAMMRAGHRIVFMSGRTEGCRDATEKWLIENMGGEFDGLFMRQVGDTRKDSIVKAELFDAFVRDRYAVTCVLDDRDQVVRMWRDIGLTVLQVADGEF